jgi:hypothetical protein
MLEEVARLTAASDGARKRAEKLASELEVSTKYGRQSTEGGTQDGRLVGGGARDDDQDVDARRTRGFI